MMGGKTASGYTIIEVMIFLAITSTLFAIAMLTINGQQSSANFTQGVRDFQASIDDTINDIRNGNFPNSTNYKCKALPDGSITFASLATATSQGTHEDCVFFGKVAQFGSSWEEVKLYSVAARRSTVAGSDPQSFLEARPTIPSVPGFQESYDLGGNIEITRIQARKGAGGGYPVWALGFFSPFSNVSDSTRPENNGLVTVVPIVGSGDGNVPDITSIVNGALTPAPTWITSNPQNQANPDVIVICLQQGGGDGKKAALILGEGNDPTGTVLHINDVDSAPNDAIGGFTC